MDTITRIAIKSIVIVGIFLVILLVVSVISSSKAKQSCTQTIERGIRDCYLDLMECLIRVNDQLRKGEAIAAFSLLTQAKQISLTLRTLHSEEFLREVSEDEEFLSRHQNLINCTKQALKSIASHPEACSSVPPNSVQHGGSASGSGATLWDDCLRLSQALDVRARIAGQAQLAHLQPVRAGIGYRRSTGTPSLVLENREDRTHPHRLTLEE